MGINQTIIIRVLYDLNILYITQRAYTYIYMEFYLQFMTNLYNYYSILCSPIDTYFFCNMEI